LVDELRFLRLEVVRILELVCDVSSGKGIFFVEVYHLSSAFGDLVQVGAVWRRTLDIHLLPIVVCQLTLVVAVRHVQAIGVVFLL